MGLLAGEQLGLGDILGHLVLYSIYIWTSYVVCLHVYRVTLHPLARFPGPKFARASYWYEAWYEVVCGGQYTNKVAKLHQKYGPIIRINPDELHCNDPDFVKTVYPVSNRKRDKSSYFMKGFGNPDQSTFMNTNHTHHRTLRAPLSKFFAKSHVSQAEQQVHEKVQKLCDKLLARRGCAPLDVSGAFSCFATDSSTEYCYGSDPCLLDQDTWELNSMAFFENVERSTHLQRSVPGLLYVVKFVPRFVFKHFCNSFYSFLDSDEAPISEPLDIILSAIQTDQIKSTPMYSSLMSSPHTSKTTAIAQTRDESAATTLAGPTSTAIVLSRIFHYLLSSPSSARRLREELSLAIPDALQLPRWSALEQLPYLSAVIHEGLRLMADGFVGGLPYETSQNRSPRIATEEDLPYEFTRHSTKDNLKSESCKVKYVIPRGFAVSTSAKMMHANESSFPNASEFLPERWLDDCGNRNIALERELWTWGKGSRHCIGMQ
ncbi:hypothetical protein VTL71DRAFT_9132 [Oculimacula yallundae]|uniref:Cytochrome P450 n=1 Tax=Oculimacula yallundae TaxID=86028 RepID=A0ABR4BTZ7_9HELO